ncbi:MAG: M67 family metallopeptidase [Zoogloeaceae bacterium]|nr:M67 family metallopeptidase [Zoogloeaceae bacterium]
MIRLPETLDAAIRAEGEKAYPNECCGVLLGRLDADGARVTEEILPIDNAREAGEQYHRFRIEADDFLRAEHVARETGRDVLGFYHSHPDHPADPSEYDREHALPFYSYIIISVRGGKAAELASWELTLDRARFEAERIVSS